MNNLTSEQQALLILVQQSLWGVSSNLPSEVNWEVVDVSAKEQGVISFACDGALAMNAEIPGEILQRWNQKMLHGVLNNERLLSAQSEIVAWFLQAGIPSAILKGSSVARYYPQPELRVLGDIDILVRKEDVDRAREILEQHGYAFQEKKHGFHLSFRRPGAYVELHYNVTKAPNSPGGQITEIETARMLDDTDEGMVGNYRFPVLSESNQALSLILHMIRHMFNTGIGLRQLCDWAVYIANADPDVFTDVTLPLLKRCGLLHYAKVATRTCVRYLGLPERKMSWCSDISDELCREFIDGIFSGGNMGMANKGGIDSLFTDRNAMGTKQSSVKALLSRLTTLSYKHFPFTKKYKILLPVFWIFLPIRYLVRAMLGLRPKKSVVKAVQTAKQQRNLYEKLHLFEVEK